MYGLEEWASRVEQYMTPQKHAGITWRVTQYEQNQTMINRKGITYKMVLAKKWNEEMSSMGSFEKKATVTTMQFNSVTFTNFPMFVAEDGEITYSLMDAVIARRYAQDFPDRHNSAIIVDFSELNTDELMREAKEALRIKSPFATREEAYEAEQKLIRILIAEGWNVANVIHEDTYSEE